MARTLIAATAALVVAASAAGCSSGGGPSETPLPPVSSSAPATTPSSTPSVTVTPSKSPSPKADVWRAKFTPAQLKLYDAALQRWQSCVAREAPIWAAGKVTPAAKTVLQDCWLGWQPRLKRLDLFRQNGFTEVGVAKVLWSRAVSVGAPPYSPRLVVIQQCVDPATVKFLPADLKIHKAAPPYVRIVTMDQPDTTKPFKTLTVWDITNQKKVDRCK